MKILFICKYNVFRSRVAEEYFKRINGNLKIKTLSRGIILGGNCNREQIKISKMLAGVDITKRKPLALTLQDLIEADLIVVVADDIPKIIFNYQLKPLKNKLKIWKIKDEQKQNSKNIERIVKSIMKRVEELTREGER